MSKILLLLLLLFKGWCRTEADAVIPQTTRMGEEVGGIELEALPVVLLIFGPNGF
jgi:hypothetical protein